MRFRHLAVLAAAVIHWMAGAVWYAAFVGPFSRYMGEARLAELQTRNAAVAFGLALSSSLVLAYALAYICRLRPAHRVVDHLPRVSIVFLGFVVATQSLTVLFEGRHPGLYVLALGYQFVAIALMVVVLTWTPQRGMAHRRPMG